MKKIIKERFKNYTISFVKQIIPVVAGILIALFIDNWNANRKDKAYLNQVFSTINSEIKDSKDDLSFTFPKQKSLTDSLRFYANDEKLTVFDIVRKNGGIFIPNIKLNAWKSVSSSKIDLIDYKKVNWLSELEENKNILSKKGDFLMNFLYSNMNATEKNTKQTLNILVQDIMQTETTIQKIMEKYEEDSKEK